MVEAATFVSAPLCFRTKFVSTGLMLHNQRDRPTSFQDLSLQLHLTGDDAFQFQNQKFEWISNETSEGYRNFDRTICVKIKGYLITYPKQSFELVLDKTVLIF